MLCYSCQLILRDMVRLHHLLLHCCFYVILKVMSNLTSNAVFVAAAVLGEMNS